LCEADEVGVGRGRLPADLLPKNVLVIEKESVGVKEAVVAAKTKSLEPVSLSVSAKASSENSQSLPVANRGEESGCFATSLCQQSLASMASGENLLTAAGL